MDDSNKNQARIKLLSLISGGIDSPVASYLMLERGAELATLYLDNQPFTDEKMKTKVITQVERLKRVSKLKIKLYIVPHGENQKMFARNCDRHVGCILCRRMMFRIGEALATREHAVALVTGESLGQVASQTLQNIRVESSAIKMPVIRPLIGLDKIEIERIAKDIGTYDISISPGLCCTIVPKKPSTNAAIERIIEEEKKVNMDSLLKEALKEVEIL
jgi:thiamine biosynthesis protein ThiI